MEYLKTFAIIAILLLVLIFINNRRKLGDVSYGEDSSVIFKSIKNVFGLILLLVGIFGCFVLLGVSYEIILMLFGDSTDFALPTSDNKGLLIGFVIGLLLFAGLIFIILEKGSELFNVNRKKKQ